MSIFSRVAGALPANFLNAAAINNIFWLAFDKVIRLFIGLFVNVWIARYMGPEMYGHYSYIFSFVIIFSVCGALGLEGVVIRELVKRPEDRNKILGSAFLLKVIGALTGMALTIAAASFMNVKTPDWLVLISISTLSFLFMPFEVLDYFFQSLVMSKYIVFARNFSLIASSAVRLYLISAGGSLMAFLLVNVIEAALTFIALIMLFSKKNSISGWTFSADLMKTLMIDSFPLMMTYLMTLIGMKIDQLMLLEMIDEKQLGYYSAAIKLSEIWYLIPMSVCSTFFPILIAIKKRSISLYMKRFQMLYDFMAVTAFAIILPVSFLSAKLIPLLYGPKYVNSAAILAIHVWAVLPVFMSVVCQYYLIVEKKQRLSFYKTIVGVITTVISNYILIPRYAAAGAACARLISEFVSSYLFDLFHPALAPALKMKIRATTLISLFNNTAIFLARVRTKK